MAEKLSLTDQLSDALQKAEYWHGQYDAILAQLKDKEEKEKSSLRDTIGRFEGMNRDILESNRQLMEVVRWHVAPDTAKKPDMISGNDMGRRY